MALRTFTDRGGDHWQVWNVIPQYVSAGAVTDAERAAALECDGAEGGRGSGVTPNLVEGWLCFEGAGDKRRLHPIPAGWEDCSEAELEALCRTAEPVRRPAPAG